MQATTKQRAQLINFMQQYILSRMQLINELHEESEVDDYEHTAQTIIACYTQFVCDNNAAVLFYNIRNGLDTMLYEDVFDALVDKCDFTMQQIFSVSKL